MGDNAGNGCGYAPLDSKLLATPFRCETNWHVITGAVCCGKTTLIDLLAGRGYQTVPEIGRQYIEGEVAKGRSLEEIFGSAADELAMTDLQLRTEGALDSADVAFLDRALPDFLWFWRLQGLDANELLAKCFRHRYASVFVLDPLPLQLDGARIDDEAYTVTLDEAITRDYKALGYHVVRVPVLPPEGRVEFVLDRVSLQGLH